MGGTISSEKQKGRVAVITGGGSGIGLEIARKCLALEMIVCVIDIDQRKLEIAEEELKQLALPRKHVVRRYVCDVTNYHKFEMVKKSIFQEFKEVAALFNNTGVAIGMSSFETPLKVWHKTMDVTFYGTLHGLNLFVPEMLKNEKPSLICNTSSLAGLVPTPREVGAPYTISKVASRYLTEALYQDLKSSKIQVALFCPGFVATDLANSSKAIASTLPDSPLLQKNETSIVQEQLNSGMSTSYVVDFLKKAINDGKFYVVPTDSKIIPLELVAEFIRLSADDVLNGNPPLQAKDRPRAQKARLKAAMKASNL